MQDKGTFDKKNNQDSVFQYIDSVGLELADRLKAHIQKRIDSYKADYTQAFLERTPLASTLLTCDGFTIGDKANTGKIVISVDRLEELTQAKLNADINPLWACKESEDKDMSYTRYTPWEKQEISKEILFEEIDKYFKTWADLMKNTINEDIKKALEENPDRDEINVFDGAAYAKYSISPHGYDPVIFMSDGWIVIDRNELKWRLADKIKEIEAAKAAEEAKKEKK